MNFHGIVFLLLADLQSLDKEKQFWSQNKPLGASVKPAEGIWVDDNENKFVSGEVEIEPELEVT